MTYSRILSIGMGIYLSMLLAVFFVTGGSPLANGITIVLIFILMAELQFALLTITRRDAPLSLLFVTVVFLFFGAPVFGYLLYPNGFIKFHSVEDVNRALLYLVLGSGTAILGIKSGSQLFTSVHDSTEKDIQRRPFYCPPWFFFAATVVNIGFVLWGAIFLGKASSLLGQYTVTAYGFLTRFVNSEVILIIGLVLAIENWPRFNKSGRRLLFLSIAIILLVGTLSGSRSALLSLFFYLLIILTNKKGNFLVGRRAAIFVGLAMLVSLLVFPLATGVRNYWNMTGRLEHHEGSFIEEIIRAATSGVDTGSTDQFKSLIYPVLYRLNGLDSLVVITSYNWECASLYINLVNEFKSFLNIIIPGNLFPAIKETSRMFLFVYQGVPITFLDFYYVTSMYTLWGICYANFGYFFGLLAIAAFMFLVAGVYQRATRLKTRFNTYWQVWCLLFAFNLIQSFGLDRSFAYAIYWLIPGVLWLAILARLSRSRRIDLVDQSLKLPEPPRVASLAYDATVNLRL